MNTGHTSLPPVFVINMPESLERRKVMEERLEALSLPHVFVDAIDGRSFDIDNITGYDRRKRLRYFGRDLTLGEIGCFLSHRKTYEEIVRKNIPYAVIVEDDILFAEGFEGIIQSLIQSSTQWDLVRFVGNEKIYRRGYRTIENLPGGVSLARLPTTPGGAYGYLLSLKAAKTLLAHTEKAWLPIDTLHGWSWKTGLEVLMAQPPPIYLDDNFDSTIGDTRFDKTIRLKGLKRLAFPLSRAGFKLYENVGKRYVYGSSWFKDRQRLKSTRKSC